jgi:hypothetical protein
MKNLYSSFLSLIIFLFFLFPGAYPQDMEDNAGAETGEAEVTELFSGPVLDSFKQKEQLIPVTSSVLHANISLAVQNENLVNVLNEIAAQSGADIIYDDQLMDIKGINLDAADEPLYRVLEELLVNCNISYYEYEPGKLAFAKTQRVDEKTGGIKGFIKDESGELLICANVMLDEIKIGCASDTKGYYLIKNIKPGEYTLEISYIGYEKFRQKIKIKAGEIIEKNVTLKSSSFQIGGIEVIGTQELLPTDVQTKTVITSGEIEHYQASSLKDVLDLVPGVQKTANPGLSSSSRVAIRGDENDAMSSFGTLIMVDGTPVSNNANLQFESAASTYNLGTGVDLRSIPADNIENIEVITGLPSVRYGDMTAGIINVQSKIGPQPHRFKFKNNPDTREANLGGGFLVGESGLSYNLNAAQSERDIRKDGDEYTRLTGQAVYSVNLFDNQLNMNNKFHFQKIFDEEEPKGDLMRIKNYNRGYTLGYSMWGKYKPSAGVSSFEYNAFVTIHRENTMKSKLIQSDLRVVNGDTITSYMGKVEIKGIEWTVGGRFEWNNIFYTGSLIHKFMIGTDPQYDANTGEGLLVDSLFNYYGANSGRRSYSYDDIPGQFLVNVYAEDMITGHFIYDFNVTIGGRYEMYRPYKFNLSGLWGDGDLVESHQGTYFNPRFNLMVYFSNVNQLRISAGTSSKSPSMNLIYPPIQSFTWKNGETGELQYFNYNRRVPDLKGYKEEQYEIAYDHKFFDILGTSVSAYYKNRINEPESQNIPVFYTYDNGSTKKTYYIDKYSLYKNSGATESKGIEFAFKTTKIKPLNMEFSIIGSYNYFKKASNTLVFKEDLDEGLYHTYPVPGTDTLIGLWYNSGESWDDYLQLNYYVKYTCPPLGLWITLRAEQILWQRGQDRDYAPYDLSIFNETQIASYYFKREIKTKPNKWLFNLNVSKSLFPGAEVSFYINNLFDDSAVYRYRSSLTEYSESIRNPDLSYGIEFSMILDKFFK